jgi:ABC-type sugar transport system ATPase subunit
MPAEDHVGAAHLTVRGVSKRFGQTRALSDVSVRIDRGTVHSLVGENGAGKSTLGKIIAGLLRPDAGAVELDAQRLDFRSPRDALRVGITAITQEHTLVPSLSVIDNVFLGRESHRVGLRTQRSDRDRYRQLADQAGFAIAGRSLVGELSLAERQEVEVIRALACDARVLVFDEPTAVLDGPEVKRLFGIIDRLRAEGRTVIFVSHFLREVLAISDAVTVLRNGQVVRTTDEVADETPDALVASMLGAQPGNLLPSRTRRDPAAPVGLQVRGLCRRGVLEDITFSSKAGEILGVAGLVGSGRTEVLRAIFGADRFERGTVEVFGETVTPGSPAQAIAAGIGFIPESRRELGLMMEGSIRDNIGLLTLRSRSTAGFVSPRRERAATRQAIETVDLRGARDRAPVAALSGGNQQKALFARWLLAAPRVLLADEPTRGVDIGAKRAIYQLLMDRAAAGAAVVVVSSDIEELLALADRALVMREGRIVAECEGEDMNEDTITAHALGVSP